MQSHRSIAVISENGSLTLEKLPFLAGELVEVVVVSVKNQSPPGQLYPLRGTPIQFTAPTSPVAESDWKA